MIILYCELLILKPDSDSPEDKYFDKLTSGTIGFFKKIDLQLVLNFYVLNVNLNLYDLHINHSEYNIDAIDSQKY